MNRLPLKTRLVNWLEKQKTWVHSGEIQRIVALNTTYTPQNTGRRLRELENEGTVEVKYERGQAWYRIKETEPVALLAARSIAWFNSLP